MTSASVIDWKPSSTVLLISDPQWNSKNGSMGLSRSTIVDVDPCIPEADWLRTFAGRLTRRESVVQPFPYDGERRIKEQGESIRVMDH